MLPWIFSHCCQVAGKEKGGSCNCGNTDNWSRFPPRGYLSFLRLREAFGVLELLAGAQKQHKTQGSCRANLGFFPPGELPSAFLGGSIRRRYSTPRRLVAPLLYNVPGEHLTAEFLLRCKSQGFFCCEVTGYLLKQAILCPKHSSEAPFPKKAEQLQ